MDSLPLSHSLPCFSIYFHAHKKGSWFYFQHSVKDTIQNVPRFLDQVSTAAFQQGSKPQLWVRNLPLILWTVQLFKARKNLSGMTKAFVCHCANMWKRMHTICGYVCVCVCVCVWERKHISFHTWVKDSDLNGYGLIHVHVPLFNTFFFV